MPQKLYLGLFLFHCLLLDTFLINSQATLAYFPQHNFSHIFREISKRQQRFVQFWRVYSVQKLPLFMHIFACSAICPDWIRIGSGIGISNRSRIWSGAREREWASEGEGNLLLLVNPRKARQGAQLSMPGPYIQESRSRFQVEPDPLCTRTLAHYVQGEARAHDPRYPNSSNISNDSTQLRSTF